MGGQISCISFGDNYSVLGVDSDTVAVRQLILLFCLSSIFGFDYNVFKHSIDVRRLRGLIYCLAGFESRGRLRCSLRVFDWFLQLEYLDLYLIHWPLSLKLGNYEYPIPKKELLRMNFKSVLKAMEE
ncbi:hypothetical protein GIB67_039880 [Kingdonia uniflora]|uniref:Uncharacterized protein n=1 Tax=Kingdonia uniflora TaxID=39325 RepID=A0A7J7P3A1_9MAGN|nr:hypothetical protein GIB67_039880 [Kingdonia uniflora]